MNETEIFSVEIEFTNPTEEEMKAMSDFCGSSITKMDGDALNFRYNIHLEYINGLRSRLKRVLKIIKDHPKTTKTTNFTKLAASELVFVKFCDEIRKLEERK